MTTKPNLKSPAAAVAAVFLPICLQFCEKCVTLQAEKFLNHQESITGKELRQLMKRNGLE